MFQTYDPVSDISFAAAHMPKLRASMAAQKLDGFLVPHDDEYQNEYIPAYAERLLWISGFSGSAGFAIVMTDKTGIFVDGRYTLQVREQTDSAFFSFHDYTQKEISDWLTQNTKKGQRIGYDPMLHTRNGLKPLEAAAKKGGFELVATPSNPLDSAWSDQPDAPNASIQPHKLEYAGIASKDKRTQIAKTLKEKNADAALITAPPSIAWAFNIRGGDVDRSPLPLSRAVIFNDGHAQLFFDQAKKSSDLDAHLGTDISIDEEANITKALEQLGANKSKVLIDPGLTPIGFINALIESGAEIIEGEDPCALPRARKNAAEIDGTRAAHIRDGAAVTKFLHWLATTGQSGEIDEIEASSKLESFRAQDNSLKDLSFDSISGSGPNGAIVHYRVTTKTNRKLEKNSLFLIDSGGQYPDGTTDITRTVPIGEPSEEMRDRFTRVLKGHIALAQARFPKGTTGTQLDTLARLPLWEAGLDYDHGTGHGVGSFLGVHEGPQRIAKAPSHVALEPGMILSNEPGFYKTGEFGIRIENLVVVNPLAPLGGGDREMMTFETITLAPIDLKLIDRDLLNASECKWLNEYHAKVRATLTPLLPDDVATWLGEATKAI